MNGKVYKRNPSYHSQKVGNEIVLVAVSDDIADMNKVFSLNETGAFIWEQLNGKNSLQDIASIICNEFDIDKDTALKNLNEFLSEISNFIIEV